jgi:hypothetical protein
MPASRSWETFLWTLKASLRAAACDGRPRPAALNQLVDCSHIATGPLARDDGYSTAGRG